MCKIVVRNIKGFVQNVQNKGAICSKNIQTKRFNPFDLAVYSANWNELECLGNDVGMFGLSSLGPHALHEWSVGSYGNVEDGYQCLL